MALFLFLRRATTVSFRIIRTRSLCCSQASHLAVHLRPRSFNSWMPRWNFERLHRLYNIYIYIYICYFADVSRVFTLFVLIILVKWRCWRSVHAIVAICCIQSSNHSACYYVHMVQLWTLFGWCARGVHRGTRILILLNPVLIIVLLLPPLITSFFPSTTYIFKAPGGAVTSVSACNYYVVLGFMRLNFYFCQYYCRTKWKFSLCFLGTLNRNQLMNGI